MGRIVSVTSSFCSTCIDLHLLLSDEQKRDPHCAKHAVSQSRTDTFVGSGEALSGVGRIRRQWRADVLLLRVLASLSGDLPGWYGPAWTELTPPQKAVWQSPREVVVAHLLAFVRYLLPLSPSFVLLLKSTRLILYCFLQIEFLEAISVTTLYLNNILLLCFFLSIDLQTDRYRKWRAPSRTRRRPIASAVQVLGLDYITNYYIRGLNICVLQGVKRKRRRRKIRMNRSRMQGNEIQKHLPFNRWLRLRNVSTGIVNVASSAKWNLFLCSPFIFVNASQNY